jgi:fatty-acyl-CoA synthase
MIGNVFTVLDRIAGTSRRTNPAYFFDDRPQSYGELRERALRVANALRGLGLVPGDRIAVLLPNCREWPEIFFGCAALGAICVPVNILNSGFEVQGVIEDCGARGLVTSDAAADRLADVTTLPELVITIGTKVITGALDYETVLAAASPATMPGPQATDLCMFFYSSGTTGAPKAAAHSHAGILWNAYQQLPDFGLTETDRYLAVPSLSWAAGFHNLIMPLWWIGGSTVLLPTGGLSAARIVAAAVETRATHTFLVPTLLKQLVASPDQLALLRTSSIRWIISGAEPVPVPVIEEINAELPGCDVVQGYGLSEFPTIATALQPHEAISKVGSAGRPMSITQLGVRLDDGSIASAGEGEVLLRSLATMKEYYGKPDLTREAFADGWLNTGDVGTVDEDGYLTITGRRKDLIISGGLNIYPGEIEDLIYRIDGVVEAAVVGVRDEQWGEVPVAIVVGSDGTLTEKAVIAACGGLSRYKRPRAVLFHSDPLPRTVTLKVLKRELRPWAEAQLGDAGPGGT